MARNVLSRALAACVLCVLARGAFAVAGDVCAGDPPGGTGVCGGPNTSPYLYFTPEAGFVTPPHSFNSAGEAIAHAKSDALLVSPTICTLSGSPGPFIAVFFNMDEETLSDATITWTSTVPNSGVDTTCGGTNVSFGTLRRQRDVICLPPYQPNGITSPVNTWCFRLPDTRDVNKGVGPQSCTACAAPSTTNPINIALGNKHQEEVDYSGSGPFPLTFTRYYNSLHGFNTVSNGQVISVRFGMHSNWRHTYERSIIVAASTRFTTAFAYRPDGKVLRFNLVNGAYVGEADVNDRLQQLFDASNQPAGWQYTMSPTDEVETYDVDGTLLSITNRAGLTQTLAYDALGRLSAVTDPAGRRLLFAYDSFGGRLSTLTDPAGQVITYAYATLSDQSSNLTSVTYQDGRARTYLYNEATSSQGNVPHALTGIQDENGDRYGTYTYDGNAAAIGAKNGINANAYALNIGSTSTEVTDPLGVKRTYSFKNVQGVARTTALSQACDYCGGANVKAQIPDANGNPASRTDWNDNRTNYTYDLARNLETQRIEGLTSAGAATAATRTISTQWHPTFRLPIQIAEPKRITTYAYDAQGNLTSKSMQATTDTTGASGFSATPTGSPRTWAYTNTYSNAVPGLMTRQVINSPRTDVADTTTYVWDNVGNLSAVTNALGHVTILSNYDAHGRPEQITDPNGLVTTLGYDLRGRLTSRNVGGEVTGYTYDGVGQLTRLTLPDGSFLSYTYDAAHRLTQIADNLGNRIVYTLDAIGNRVKEDTLDPANALARTRSRAYDSSNRLTQDIGGANPATEITRYAYDNQGNLTGITDPLSHVTTNGYDALSRLIKVIDPAASGSGPGGNTQYTYDGADQLTQVTDPRNLATRYTLDGLGNLTQQVSPDTGTTANSDFDAAGNLKTSTDARGVVASLSYDALNRLTQATYTPPPGSAITPVTLVYTYDQGAYGKGRLSGFSDPSGATTYVYDQHGRLTQNIQTIAGVPFTTGYAYDPAGRLARMTYPSGRALDYTFDAAGRVRQIDTSYGNVTQAVVSNVAYQPLGAVKSFLFGNGSVYSRGFDLDGRISSYSLANSTRTLSYDADSRITGFTQADPALNQSFGYDNLGRLTSWVPATTSQSYAYDLNGNRISATYGIQGYGYHARQQQPIEHRARPDSAELSI
jgi:YD repeat-containing protein